MTTTQKFSPGDRVIARMGGPGLAIYGAVRLIGAIL